MFAWPLLVVCLAATPPIEVSTLKGEQYVGSLERLSSEEVVLKTPTGAMTIPGADLLSVRVPAGTTVPAISETAIEIRLTDGTRLRASSFASTGTEAAIEHPQLGPLKLPVTVVQSVRFSAPDPKVDAAWNQLLDRTVKKDQVAVRKGDVLDHLDGVIGSLDEATVKFQLDGDEIPVKRERVFGLIYARRENLSSKAVAAVDLSSGDRLAAKAVSFDGEAWKVKLVSGAEVSLPMPLVQTVDFTLGKIAYLSNLEPREIKYTPFWENLHTWEYRRDRMTHGGPISVGNKTYAKGLGIHSRTLLKYRIGGNYRRFQTIMGIDDSLRNGGDVDVVIKGDGRTLFKGPVSIHERSEPGAANSTEPRLMQPIKLDLDVTGIVELEILVDFGELTDVGDCLDLADAKVVK
ncbi:MAG: NPCBM/NEW2 domain-containing protein [Planctomycetota bacterium]